MKYLILPILLVSTISFLAFSQERKAGFQTGKIVNVERIPGAAASAPSPSGYPNPGSPTQAQEGPRVYGYNVFIQVGDTIYTCRLKSYDPDDPEFAPGSEVQARVSKRVVYLKRTTNDVEEARIVSKKKAETQAQAQ